MDAEYSLSERNIFQVTEVFTPTTPARVTFVDRTSINDRLVDALRTPGMQLVVFGHSGTGKTTLLTNKLRQLYAHHITTRCMKGTTFTEMIRQAFQELGRFYASEHSTTVRKNISAEVSASYLNIKSTIAAGNITEGIEKSTLVLPPQLTPQTLGKFLGECGACWVLEDFHKIAPSEKIFLSQMMKVFMDMADDYPSLKVIAIGAVDTGRQVVEYDVEMKNRVGEVRVDLMTDDEILSIIEKGESALNIEIPTSLKNFIAVHANGLPATCHHICLKICRCAGINETSGAKIGITRTHCDEGLGKYVDECSDSIKAVFDNALKDRRKSRYQQPSLVLYALTFFNMGGASRQEIWSRIKITSPQFPEASLRTLLAKLISQEYSSILKYDSNSAKFSFTDPVYKAYAMARLKHEQKAARSETTMDVGQIDISEILEELSILLNRMRERRTVALN